MRSRAAGATRREKCLQFLTGDEASAVLRALLAAHPYLVPDAVKAANGLLTSTSFTAIAQGVFNAVVELGLDDFDAGPRVAGYLEPSEAAWAAIERAVAPYFDDLKRRMMLRRREEAAEICKGIVIGLYRAEQRGFELLEYAEDCPTELAAHAVDIVWRRRGRRERLPSSFIEKFVPEWDWLNR
jgi:hypothetical protein